MRLSPAAGRIRTVDAVRPAITTSGRIPEPASFTAPAQVVVQAAQDRRRGLLIASALAGGTLEEAAMITGSHLILFAHDAQATR